MLTNLSVLLICKGFPITSEHFFAGTVYKRVRHQRATQECAKWIRYSTFDDDDKQRLKFCEGRGLNKSKDKARFKMYTILYLISRIEEIKVPLLLLVDMKVTAIV